MCLNEPALVVAVDAAGDEAVVTMRGARRRLSVALLTLQGERVGPGDWVLAGMGMAVERLDEEDATALAALVAEARNEEDAG